MCLRYKTFFFLNFVTGLCIVIFLCTAMGTTHWMDVNLKRNESYTSSGIKLVSDNDDPGPHEGFMHFGVIRGCKIFNYGYGARDYQCFNVFEEHQDVYKTNLLVVVVVCMVASAIFALVATVFGLVNAITVPIESIHGPRGLFIWNSSGAFFSGTALILYVVLYYTQMKYNVLNYADIGAPNFFVTDEAVYGYSFWLLVVSFTLFCINIILLVIAHFMNSPNFRWRERAAKDSNRQTSEVGLGIMY